MFLPTEGGPCSIKGANVVEDSPYFETRGKKAALLYEEDSGAVNICKLRFVTDHMLHSFKHLKDYR